MQRMLPILVAVLLVVVVAASGTLFTQNRQTNDRLRELLCVERANATAAIAVIVPEAQVDPEGRVQSARTLSSLLDAC